MHKIMVFTWNTESVNLSETLDKDKADSNRHSFFTSWRYSCHLPDFFPQFSNKITSNNPDIVVIGFQEDRYPGSYFHSHLLPEEMPKIGYGLVKRTKLMGFGKTSYDGLWNGDLYQRGIRISIYAKFNLVSIIEKEELNMRQSMGNNGQLEYSANILRSKGAVASYIMLPGFGHLAFVCCHLPFNARSLITERVHKNRMLRQNELNESNIVFNNIIEKLVFDQDQIPTHVIYFGDFNYRLADMRPASEVASEFLEKKDDIDHISKMYAVYDELHEQSVKQNIYEFSEGVNNQGPTFMPTCKMVKGRDTEEYNLTDGTECWKIGREDQRIPSWCDRILYKKIGDDGHTLKCVDYDRFDIGSTMSKSDHAGVIGIFELY
jgi:hypothetical protein